MIISCVPDVIVLSHEEKVTMNKQIILLFFINFFIFLKLDYCPMRCIGLSIGMIVHDLLK